MFIQIIEEKTHVAHVSWGRVIDSEALLGVQKGGMFNRTRADVDFNSRKSIQDSEIYTRATHLLL